MDKLIYKRIGIVGGAVSFLLMILVASGLFWLEPGQVLAQSDADRTAVNQDLTIEKGDVVRGNAVVTSGNLTVLGEVRGEVVVARGNARIKGTVHGNVTVTDGNVELGPKSVVEGNVLAVVGNVTRDPSAKVVGTVNAPNISLEGVTNSVLHPDSPQLSNNPEGASASAPTGAGGALTGLIQLFSKGMMSVVLLVLGLLLVAVVPTRVSLSSATLEAAPVPSLVVGLITAFLLFPVSGILVMALFISIVGWLFLPVLAVGILAALLFGLVAVSTWIGRGVYESVHPGHSVLASKNHLFVHVLLGMSIVLGMTLVPSVLLPGSVSVLMFLLLYFASCVGIASAILSRFGTLVPPKHAHYYQAQHAPVQNAQANYGIIAPMAHPVVETKPPMPSDPGPQLPPSL